MTEKIKTDRDFIKVSFKTPRYYVNEPKRTVVCVLDFFLDVPCPTNTFFLESAYHGFTDSVVGVAKCSEDDVFDEKTGKEIASSRAEQKAYDKCMRELLKQRENVNVYEKMVDNFIKLGDSVIGHNNAYIKRIGQ